MQTQERFPKVLHDIAEFYWNDEVWKAENNRLVELIRDLSRFLKQNKEGIFSIRHIVSSHAANKVQFQQISDVLNTVGKELAEATSLKIAELNRHCTQKWERVASEKRAGIGRDLTGIDHYNSLSG